MGTDNRKVVASGFILFEVLEDGMMRATVQRGTGTGEGSDFAYTHAEVCLRNYVATLQDSGQVSEVEEKMVTKEELEAENAAKRGKLDG